MSLMDRLKADPRHENVVMLTESEEVRERLFPNWDMELVTITECCRTHWTLRPTRRMQTC